MFGATPQQPSLFGGATPQPFGSFQPQAAVVPQVTVRETTTFEELPPGNAFVSQERASQIQRALDQNRQIRESVEQLGDVTAKELSASVRTVREALARAENAQHVPRAAAADLLKDASVLADLAAKTTTAPTSLELPSRLLWRHVNHCDRRLDAYKQHVANLSTEAPHKGDASLARILHAQNDTFMNVAAKLAASRSRVERLKSRYLRVNDDVFARRDREDRAEDRRVLNQIRADAASAQPAQPAPASYFATGFAPAPAFQQPQQQASPFSTSFAPGNPTGVTGMPNAFAPPALGASPTIGAPTFPGVAAVGAATPARRQANTGGKSGRRTTRR